MDYNLSNIKERCLFLANFKGYTLEDFCSKIGMTYGSFKGKAKNTALNSHAMEKIMAMIPDVNITWLLTGRGPMILAAGCTSEGWPSFTEPDPDEELLRRIEQLTQENVRLKGKIEAQNDLIKLIIDRLVKNGGDGVEDLLRKA